MNDRPRRSVATRSLNIAGNPAPKSPANRRHKPDYWVFVLMSLLLTIGLVVIYSISPGLAAAQHISQNYFISKHLIDVLLALVTFGVAAFMPLGNWSRLAKPLAVAAIAGSLIVILMPVDAVYQAHRWIRFGGFSFQIAELIKLALVVWLAQFLTNKWRAGKLADYKTVIQPLLIILVVIGVMVAKFQSDLGSAGVMIAIMGAMAFTIGLGLKRIAIISGVVLVLGILAISTSNYRRDRLFTFLHPGSNCQSTSYQACQALISVGSGGLFGQGLGYGVQAYGYQPEPANDSIFAIMAEKFGFIGSSLIIVIYAVFITRLKRIVEHTSDQFNRLMVIGILAWISTQMIINVGAMVGLLPLKGITLPLISQGGTSLVFLTAALGLVFQISRYTSYSVTEPTPTDYEKDNNFNRRRDGRAYNPSLIARPRA